MWDKWKWTKVQIKHPTKNISSLCFPPTLLCRNNSVFFGEWWGLKLGLHTRCKTKPERTDQKLGPNNTDEQLVNLNIEVFFSSFFDLFLVSSFWFAFDQNRIESAFYFDHDSILTGQKYWFKPIIFMFKPVFNSCLLMTICYNVPENQLKDQHIPSIKMPPTTAIPILNKREKDFQKFIWFYGLIYVLILERSKFS